MRAQDLRRKPFDWLKNTLSSFGGLNKGAVPAKIAHSFFNKAQKYLVQAAKTVENLLFELKVLKAENKAKDAVILAKDAKILDLEAQVATLKDQNLASGHDFNSQSSQEVNPEDRISNNVAASSLSQQPEITRFKNENSLLKAKIEDLSKANSRLSSQITDANANMACRDVKEELYEAKIVDFKAKIADLEAKIAAPRPNSRNSHKPPSSDMDSTEKKSQRPKKGPKRKAGKQPGSPRKIRQKADPEKATSVTRYKPEDENCPCCGTRMEPAPERDVQHDQLELPPVTIETHVHIGEGFECPNCHKVAVGKIPKEIVAQGLIGPRLQSFIAMTHTACNVPLRKINDLLDCAFGARISLGMVNKTLKSIAMVLRPAYEELGDNVRSSKELFIDETPFKNRGKRFYVWAFESDKFTFFDIGTRSTFVLEEVLGSEFDGFIHCDHYTAYIKYSKLNPKATLVFCWAHLDRDAINCSEYLDPEMSKYGEILHELITEMFNTQNAIKDIEDPESEECQALVKRRQELRDLITDTVQNAPNNGKFKGLKKRFAQGPDESGYFVFFNIPKGEMTNNDAERSLRPIVLFRKVSLGTQSGSGKISLKVMFTVWRTLVKLGAPCFNFLIDSLKAFYSGAETPSLFNLGNTVPHKYREMAFNNTKAELEADAKAKVEEAKARAEKEAEVAVKKLAKAKALKLKLVA